MCLETIWYKILFFIFSLNATSLPVITIPKTVNTSLSPGKTVQPHATGFSAGKYSTTANVTTSATLKSAFMMALTVSSSLEPAIRTTITPAWLCMPTEYATLAATRRRATGMALTVTSRSPDWLLELW